MKIKFVQGAVTALALLGAPMVGKAAEFRFAGPVDVYTLDPHGSANAMTLAVMRNVYDTLVTYAPDLTLIPALATDWQQIDNLTWEFKLRQGVKFSNGNDFNADDVVFSFERARKGALSNALLSVDRVEKIDDFTIHFITKATNPILPKQILNWFIIDKEWAVQNGAEEPGRADNTKEGYANRNAMGTGPYLITVRDPGVKTEFVANPSWWGRAEKKGNIDKASFFVIPNPSTRMAALISGEVDMIDRVPTQDVDRIQRAEGFKIVAGSDLRTVYMQPDVARDTLIHGSGVADNPFRDKRVRQAMQLAIDVESIGQRVMRGYATPNGVPVPRELDGLTDALREPVKPDIEKARALMQEAGYGDGFSVTLDCSNDGFMNDEATCIAIGSFLSQINIKVMPRTQTVSLFAKQVNGPEYNSSLSLQGYANLDIGHWLTVVAVTRDPQTGLGGFNIGGYSNAQVDDLSQQINSEMDAEKRRALMGQVMEVMKEDVGFIPIHQLQLLWGVKEGVDVTLFPRLIYALDWFLVPE